MFPELPLEEMFTQWRYLGGNLDAGRLVDLQHSLGGETHTAIGHSCSRKYRSVEARGTLKGHKHRRLIVSVHQESADCQALYLFAQTQNEYFCEYI